MVSQSVDDQTRLCASRLLTAAQMQAVDQAAVAQGLDSYELMRSAGTAVADVAVRLLQARAGIVLVLAGPGNNGGDGAVAATVLRQSGYEVVVVRFLPSPVAASKSPDKVSQSDADQAFGQWDGETIEYALQDADLDRRFSDLVERSDVIIDALFGAGLTRPLQGILAAVVDCINKAPARVLAVDVPSGLDGNTHHTAGVCVQADETVTFFLFKPAHFLFPGRALCGRKTLAQIGLSLAQLNPDWPLCFLNGPPVFQSAMPLLTLEGHKFDRGHVLVRSGPLHSTGASRLSAQTAIECGAGLVTLASSREALPVNASHLTAVMLKPCDNAENWRELLQDKRINTAVIGPGNGVNEATQDSVIAALESGKHCVLDADALSCWPNAGDRQKLSEALAAAERIAVLTPHAGEFARLFGDLFDSDKQTSSGSRLHTACAAARHMQAIVVFKGADTVIAAPDGRSAINANAPPWLATAGSGDVLTGLTAALLAQGMSAFEAACAAVWIHGQAAQELGYPMSAERLVGHLAEVVHAVSPINDNH